MTSQIAEGTMLVGSFGMGATYYVRSDLTIESTNSNEDDFLNNLVALRAELRGCWTVSKPLAFSSVTNIA